MKICIGIDLGGTNIRAGRVNGDVLEVLNQAHTPKNAKSQWDTIECIIELIQSVASDQVEGIGIGVPSVVDRSKGIVYNVTNIPYWEEVYLKDILEKEFGIPVYLDNDANCFALGEHYFGIGREFDHFVGLTIGTGLGGGIIQGGELLHDANCGSGEFGMLPYKDQTLEYYASGSFFENIYGVNGNEMFLRAERNELAALEAYRELGRHLAEGVKMVMLTIDPQMIVFGGSVAKAHKLFEESMYEGLKDFAFPKSVKNLEIYFSKLDHPGILGAVSLCY